MTSDERARLRALYRGIAMPWEAADHVEDGDVIATGTEIICEADDSDMGAVVVVTVDMGFDRECDEAHAALILGAVNALPALLDDSERLAKAERERDEARAEAERLRARLHRCAQCGADDSAVAACEGDEYPLCGPCAASALREARADAAAALAHTDREVGEICRTLPEALRLAAEDEREACAVICDEIEASCRAMQREHAVAGRHAAASEAWEMAGVAEDCADAIRARGAGGAR